MNYVDLRYSKDGGRNWSEFRKIELGETGDFVKRVQARALGMGRQWVFEIRVTDPIRADILSGSMLLEQTDS